MKTSLCLILDFGGTQSLSLARKVRGVQVYCEIVPAQTSVDALRAQSPACLILSGETGETGKIAPSLLNLDIPVLALGSSASSLLEAAGGAIERNVPHRHTGAVSFADDALFEGVQSGERLIEGTGAWALPDGFEIVATGGEDEAVGFACPGKNWYGLRFYPESNDPDGLMILENFLLRIAQVEAGWTLERFLEDALSRIREQADGQRVAAALPLGTHPGLQQRAVGAHRHLVGVGVGDDLHPRAGH